LQKKMVPEAVSAFRQCITTAPDHAQGHRALGEVLLYQGQTNEALAELHRAIELDPNDPGSHMARAKALAATGRNDEAEDELRKSRTAKPQ